MRTPVVIKHNLGKGFMWGLVIQTLLICGSIWLAQAIMAGLRP